MSTFGKLFAATVMVPFYLAYKVPMAAGQGLYNAFKRKNDDEDAAWPTHKELQKAGYLERRGFLVGVTMEKGKPVYVDDETSVIVKGLRGAGKTQATIANLKSVVHRERKPHIIVADPAGDIERATLADLKAAGYGAITLNLPNFEQGNQYDPLTAVGEDLGNDAQNLAELLMAAEPWNKYRHFIDLGQEFIRGLIVHAVTTEENPSLGDIVQLILSDKNKFDATVKVMQHSVHDYVRAAATVYARVSPEEKGSFDSTLLRKLKPWIDKNMRAVTTLKENEARWGFDDVLDSKKPVIIYIRTGLNRAEFGGHLIRLIMGNVINAVKRRWDATETPIENGLWVITDEARLAGFCAPLPAVVNELRKARVNVWLCFHFLQDIKELYTNWQSLVNGCAIIVNGGSGDKELYQRVVDFAGDRRSVTKTVSKSSSGQSESEHESRAPFLTVNKLNAMPVEECVIMVQRMLMKVNKAYRIHKRGDKRWVEYFN